MEMLALVTATLLAVLLNMGLVLVIVRHLLIICPPDRVLVLSGRTTQSADGTVRGYRLVRGGRAVRIPLLERADWLLLQPARLEQQLELGDVGEVIVSGVVRIGSDQRLHAAIERYLGRHEPPLLDDATEPILAAVRVAAAGAGAMTEADLAVVAESASIHADAALQPIGLAVESLTVKRA